MKIGILGAGNIGAAAARLFVAAGHDVAVSNSRGPDSLCELITELGPQAYAMTIHDAARFGDVVLLAVPWRSPEALPEPELLRNRSEEHTTVLQSPYVLSYAVFCLIEKA